MFEPIRDYVGEALARSLNGTAGRSDTSSGGDDAMSPANRAGYNGGGFQSKATEAPKQKRESHQQEPPTEPQWRRGSFTAEHMQAMKFSPTSFLVEGIIPAEGVTLL
jgi:hypothetical protein